MTSLYEELKKIYGLDELVSPDLRSFFAFDDILFKLAEKNDTLKRRLLRKESVHSALDRAISNLGSAQSPNQGLESDLEVLIGFKPFKSDVSDGLFGKMASSLIAFYITTSPIPVFQAGYALSSTLVKSNIVERTAKRYRHAAIELDDILGYIGF